MQDKTRDAATQESLLSAIAADADVTQPRSATEAFIRESSLVLRVRAAIRRIAAVDVDAVKVVATGGVVELYGELDSAALIEEAVAAAKQVGGAQIVISNMSHR